MTERKVKTRIYSVSVGTTAKQVCKENPKRICIHMIASATGPIYITSAQNKPYTEGYPVSNTKHVKNNYTTAPLWAITSSGTLTLYVWEDSEA